MPVVLLPILALVIVASLPALAGVRRAPRAMRAPHATGRRRRLSLRGLRARRGAGERARRRGQAGRLATALATRFASRRQLRRGHIRRGHSRREPLLAGPLPPARPRRQPVRGTRRAGRDQDMPLRPSDLADMRRLMATAYQEERVTMHRRAVEWLNSLGRSPLRVTDAQAAARPMATDVVTLVDGTVLWLSHTGYAVRDIAEALDRFVEVALTRVRAAHDGFELTFDVEGRLVHARADLLTVRAVYP